MYTVSLYVNMAEIVLGEGSGGRVIKLGERYARKEIIGHCDKGSEEEPFAPLDVWRHDPPLPLNKAKLEMKKAVQQEYDIQKKASDARVAPLITSALTFESISEGRDLKAYFDMEKIGDGSSFLDLVRQKSAKYAQEVPKKQRVVENGKRVYKVVGTKLTYPQYNIGYICDMLPHIWSACQALEQFTGFYHNDAPCKNSIMDACDTCSPFKFIDFGTMGKVVKGAEFMWPSRSKQYVTISGTGAATFYYCLNGAAAQTISGFLILAADKTQIFDKLQDMGFKHTDTTAAPAPVATAATLRPQLHVPAT